MDVVVELEQKEERDISDRSKEGLRLIPNTSAGLTVEEEDNAVTIGTGYRAIREEWCLKKG